MTLVKGVKYNFPAFTQGCKDLFIPGDAWLGSYQQLYSSFHITADIAAGINEFGSLKGGIALYPNPAESQVNVGFTLTAPEKVSIVVTDIAGRVVSTAEQGSMGAGNHEVSLDLPSLNAGMYFVNVNAGKYSGTQRLMITK